MAGRPDTDLELLDQFVNTLNVETGADEIVDPAGLAAWLTANGLLETTGPPDADGHRRALELREILRRLAVANNEHVADPEATRDLNDLAARIPMILHLDPDGTATLQAPNGGIDTALARLLAIVMAASVDGTWPRFKACRNDECRWAFYDTSKNRSRRWCDMAACGDVINARAYRQRQRRQQDHPSG